MAPWVVSYRYISLLSPRSYMVELCALGAFLQAEILDSTVTWAVWALCFHKHCQIKFHKHHNTLNSPTVEKVFVPLRKLLPTVALMNLFKISQIWWVKNVSLVSIWLALFCWLSWGLSRRPCYQHLQFRTITRFFFWVVLSFAYCCRHSLYTWILILSVCICADSSSGCPLSFNSIYGVFFFFRFDVIKFSNLFLYGFCVLCLAKESLSSPKVITNSLLFSFNSFIALLLLFFLHSSLIHLEYILWMVWNESTLFFHKESQLSLHYFWRVHAILFLLKSSFFKNPL